MKLAVHLGLRQPPYLDVVQRILHEQERQREDLGKQPTAQPDR